MDNNKLAEMMKSAEGLRLGSADLYLKLAKALMHYPLDWNNCIGAIITSGDIRDNAYSVELHFVGLPVYDVRVNEFEMTIESL